MNAKIHKWFQVKVNYYMWKWCSTLIAILMQLVQRVNIKVQMDGRAPERFQKDQEII